MTSLRERCPVPTTPCPSSCGRQKPCGRYLCNACWRQLPAETKELLYLRDRNAIARFRNLLAQLADAVPLSQIRVTP